MDFLRAKELLRTWGFVLKRGGDETDEFYFKAPNGYVFCATVDEAVEKARALR